MTSSSRHFPSITSFISHATGLKQIRFPHQQITQYCKENEASHQKIVNIFQAYYQRFKWNYDNFNEIVVLLSIAIKQIQLKPSKLKGQEESIFLIKKSLNFLQDLITSKMILVCIAAKNQHKNICQHFLYAKGFINLLIPQVLDFELHCELIELLENCNKAENSTNFISLNFIVEFMTMSSTVDFLNEESERKFKGLIMEILEQKKRVIVGLIWNSEQLLQKRIEFREIAYPRKEVESYKISHLEISNEGKLYSSEKGTFSPEEWITGAYQKAPNASIWKNMSLKNAIEIYQFLFKLEVFASSPLIEQLDLLIPSDSDEFIDLFSKFLMGENLIQVKQKNQEKDSNIVIQNIFDIKKILDGANKAQKIILKKELSKICSDSEDESDITYNSES